MKFLEKVGNGPRNERLNFGGDLDHCLVLFSGFVIIGTYGKWLTDINLLLILIRIGKTCLGGGMHCPSASSCIWCQLDDIKLSMHVQTRPNRTESIIDAWYQRRCTLTGWQWLTLWLSRPIDQGFDAGGSVDELPTRKLRSISNCLKSVRCKNACLSR